MLEGQQHVAPGLGPVYGVRWPLMAALARGFRRATRGEPRGPLLDAVERCFTEPKLEPRWFAFGLLELTLADDTDVFYFVSAPYAPAHQQGIRWDDAAIGVQWPLGAPTSISERDRTFPDLRPAATR